MAKISMLCFVVALVVAGTLLLSGEHVLAQDCKVDIPTLVMQCEAYVRIPGPMVPPSESCCAAVKGIDIPCVCKMITPDIERVINMTKVVFVADKCGMPLDHGSKCGDYTVPKA